VDIILVVVVVVQKVEEQVINLIKANMEVNISTHQLNNHTNLNIKHQVNIIIKANNINIQLGT